MSERKLKFLGSNLVFFLVFLVVVIVLNLIGRQISLRADLTQDKIYTVSEATKNILKRLQDDIRVTYYISKEPPNYFKRLSQKTVDLLRELRRVNPERFRFQVVDPDREAEVEGAKMAAERERKKREAEAKGEEYKEEDDLDFLDRQFGMFGGKPAKSDKDRYLRRLATQGIVEFGWDVLRENRRELAYLYSAIKIEYLDKTPEVIGRHITLDTFEYEMASRILKLVNEEKPKVAFFDGRPNKPEPPAFRPGMPPRPPMAEPNYGAIIDGLRQQFDVSEIKLAKDDGIPEGTSCLIVAQPDNLTERQVYEINRYVSSGGPAVFFISKFSVDLKGSFGVSLISSGLDDLLKTWGVSLGGTMLEDHECGNVMVPTRVRGMPIQVMQQVPLPLLVRALQTGMNQQSPLTRGLPSAILPWAVAIEKDKGTLEKNGIQDTDLMKSSEKTWHANFGVSRFGGGPTLQNFLKQERDVAEDEYLGPQLLALQLEGKFPFKWEGTEVPQWPKETEEEAGSAEGGDGGGEEVSPETEPESKAAEPPAGKEAPEKGGAEGKAPEKKEPEKKEIGHVEGKDSMVVIVGSGDLLKDDYLQMSREYVRNFYLLSNCVETFALGQDLIKIRGKELQDRPFDPEVKEGTKTFWMWFNVIGVPLLVALLGIVRYVIRSQEVRIYERKFRA